MWRVLAWEAAVERLLARPQAIPARRRGSCLRNVPSSNALIRLATVGWVAKGCPRRNPLNIRYPYWLSAGVGVAGSDSNFLSAFAIADGDVRPAPIASA